MPVSSVVVSEVRCGPEGSQEALKVLLYSVYVEPLVSLLLRTSQEIGHKSNCNCPPSSAVSQCPQADMVELGSLGCNRAGLEESLPVSSEIFRAWLIVCQTMSVCLSC